MSCTSSLVFFCRMNTKSFFLPSKSVSLLLHIETSLFPKRFSSLFFFLAFIEDKIISSTIEKSSIQLQILFQYDQKDLHIMIYGARNIPRKQGLFACQLSLQYERDIL